MPYLRIPAAVLFSGLLAFFFVGCKEANTNNTAGLTPDTAESFQSVLDEVVTLNKDVPGLMLHVEAPGLNVSWNGAAGVSDVQTQTPLKADQPFRVASVTKTFVAAAILRLMEDGKLKLDDPISQYISPEHIAILKSGGYHPDQIRIRHLLSHTSGLFDYAVGSKDYVTEVKKNPARRWTRTEQLQGAMKWGKAYGAPGEKYYYSDTGYILLGETIEKLTGKSLPQSLRELIDYKQLNLNSTWMETLEEVPAKSPDRVHQYLDEIDTYGWDASIDLYGGGGIVSTTSDIARFYAQLFQKKVFRNPATLDTMLTKVAFPATNKEKPSRREVDYRYGVEVIQIFGMDIYLHTGFWGTQVAYVPQLNAAIAINFIKGDNLFVLKRIILMIKDMQ